MRAELARKETELSASGMDVKKEDLAQKIKPSDSLWELEEEEITITLTKALKGETWLSVFKNHDQLNFMEKEEVQKKLLLERFQEEVNIIYIMIYYN